MPEAPEYICDHAARQASILSDDAGYLHWCAELVPFGGKPSDLIDPTASGTLQGYEFIAARGD